MTEVEVSVLWQATHHWPDASPNRIYLSHPHAHDFRFTVWARVGHGDREIEFHDLRTKLYACVTRLGKINAEETGVLPSAGTLSCEQMGERILEMMPEVGRVRVAEDDFVAAVVYREEA